MKPREVRLFNEAAYWHRCSANLATAYLYHLQQLVRRSRVPRQEMVRRRGKFHYPFFGPVWVLIVGTNRAPVLAELGVLVSFALCCEQTVKGLRGFALARSMAFGMSLDLFFSPALFPIQRPFCHRPYLTRVHTLHYFRMKGVRPQGWVDLLTAH